MSNLYGGKQGFSFNLVKSYDLNDSKDYSEEEEKNLIIKYLKEQFGYFDKTNVWHPGDREVTYGDYIFLDNSKNRNAGYIGHLYRKEKTKFKYIGNLRGMPGSSSGASTASATFSSMEVSSRMTTEGLSFKYEEMESDS